MVGERRFELPASWSRTKRATRLRYSPNFNKVNDLPEKVQKFYAKIGISPQSRRERRGNALLFGGAMHHLGCMTKSPEPHVVQGEAAK